MATQAREITFVVPGQTVRVTARPGEVVVLGHIANGPTLYLHPEDARELLRAQAGGVPPTARGSDAPPVDGEVAVPAQLSWRGLDSPSAATRGGVGDFLGEVWVDALEIVTGGAKDKAAQLAAAAVTKKLDDRVEAGVYKLSPEELPRLKGSGRKVDKVSAASGGGP